MNSNKNIDARLSRAMDSVKRGCDWIDSQMDARGSIQDAPDAVVYYKSPAILALNGRLESANRCLDWIAQRFLGPKGELAIPADQEKSNAFNTYDRGWVCWGALLCGRYDIAFRLAEDIRSFQDPATGGFWDSQAARAAGQGRQHAMSVGIAGFALLATRHVAAAEQAARFVGGIVESQGKAEEGLYIAMDVGPGSARQLRKQKTPIDFLEMKGLKQRPGRFGPVLVLLARLYRVTGDESCLRSARAYIRAMLAAGEGAYLCVEGHKFVWGLTEVDNVAGGADHAEYVAAADKIVDYIIGRQRGDGQWYADSGVPDQTKDQPLFWRIDTTCNVLVGLMHYCWWKSRPVQPAK